MVIKNWKKHSYHGSLLIILNLLLSFSSSVCQNIQIVLEGEFNAHNSNRALFNSPIVSHDGKIYTAYINPKLETVVAQKKDQVWSQRVVSSITQPDTWHNAPSIAVDSQGFIHVVYNMHSNPWQYSVSKNPENISEWEFRGQYAGTNPGKGVPSQAGCSGNCYDEWMGEGVADIPGNQITYPFLTKDRNGVLYISFREAYNCSNSDYFSREWSGGLAKYDVDTKTWERLAGMRPFAHDPNYVPAAGGMHFFFDPQNRVHVSWVWGRHYSSSDGSNAFFNNPNYPSYAYSDDGGETFRKADGVILTIPLSKNSSEQIISSDWINPNNNGFFFGYTIVSAMPDGTPYVYIWPKTTSSEVDRAWIKHDSTNGWTKPQKMPWNATKLLIDKKGIITAFSSGSRVHRSYDKGQNWTTYDVDLTDGLQIPVPDYGYFYDTDKIRFMTISNRESNNIIKIWTLEFLSENGQDDKESPESPKNVKVTKQGIG